MTLDPHPDRNAYEAAAVVLEGITVRTPLLPVHDVEGGGSGRNLLLKPETFQPVGSFKLRGVFHAVARLEPSERARGLCTVSAGNTAQALAWCGRHFGVPTRSIMPDTAPATKIAAVEAWGGRAELVPVAEVFRYLRERGWEADEDTFVHPWTDPDVRIGHGTLGLEILADRPDVDCVYIPVGGGGLLGGVGGALREMKPGIRIVAVEPEGCPALHRSLARGAPSSVSCNTICDGVAVPYITEEMFPLLADLTDECRLVSDDAVRSAVRKLALEDKLVAEPSGALALAAALAECDSRVGTAVCIVTGGSIDPAKLAEILTGS